MEHHHVIVAGAGIVGAAIAWRLAQRGAAVTVVERDEPGQGATANSFAWINATFEKKPHAYYLLNRLGLAAWREADVALAGRLGVRWGGSVTWASGDSAGALRSAALRHAGRGYDLTLLDADTLRVMEPNVEPGSFETGVHFPLEGQVDPVGAARAFLAAAQRHGAQIVSATEVTGIVREGGALRGVRTNRGDLDADALVVACGVDTSRVAALAGLEVPLIDSPGVLAHSAPIDEPVVGRVILAPGAHLKQKPDGRIVTGARFGGSNLSMFTEAGGRELLGAAAQVVPLLRDVPLEQVTLGLRPMPRDGYPIVGFDERAPGVYAVVTHSGVTLAPLLGQLAAAEILDGVDAELLAPYRLARFG